ncbi:META domain-containing protein [Bisgaardia hudsonensis]|uniref:META domain-containing protein n=1 Tax=Bisgaardia hudsonensis TaxID=109472 RepID=A0A4R2N0M7_9PAST|nr:META domain-containing protein [Bisgaardia hudsonensis]QLB13509.1 hypothetical protein A6A11_07760 [Bisgaardia hudsonensis]TCP12923.1 META domain-containing protein [Bisgaardia hudsonensis]
MYCRAKLIFTSFLIMLFVAGCSSLLATNNQKLAYKILEDYKWELVEAKNADGQIISSLFINSNKPLVLNFMSIDGAHTLALENTCNKYLADYQIKDNDVELGSVASTLIACPETLANFDLVAENIISGKYAVSKDTNHLSILTITSPSYIAYFRAIAK